MSLIDAIGDVVRKAGENIPMDDTYEKDGLLFCSKCHTARQKRLELFGTVNVVSCLCKCMNDAYAEEEEKRKRDARLRAIMEYRRDGFSDAEMRSSTFGFDDMKHPELTKAMQAYVENFHDLRKDGKGLLLWGPVGTGKSFYAAFVVNALIDRGYPCMMTKVTRLVDNVSGLWEDKQRYIDGLSRYALVVLDDLGVERNTEYMNEQVYGVIDSLYRAEVPMIVTTNNTPKQMAAVEEIEKQRIYDRVLERCHPIKVDGESRRREMGRNGFRETNRLLGIEG